MLIFGLGKSLQIQKKKPVLTTVKPTSRTVIKKIDYITRGPTLPHDSDKNYSPGESFVSARCLLDQKISQKRKDWWSKFLVSLKNVREQTLLLWVIKNRF